MVKIEIKRGYRLEAIELVDDEGFFYKGYDGGIMVKDDDLEEVCELLDNNCLDFKVVAERWN